MCIQRYPETRGNWSKVKATQIGSHIIIIPHLVPERVALQCVQSFKCSTHLDYHAKFNRIGPWNSRAIGTKFLHMDVAEISCQESGIFFFFFFFFWGPKSGLKQIWNMSETRQGKELQATIMVLHDLDSSWDIPQKVCVQLPGIAFRIFTIPGETNHLVLPGAPEIQGSTDPGICSLLRLADGQSQEIFQQQFELTRDFRIYKRFSY